MMKVVANTQYTGQWILRIFGSHPGSFLSSNLSNALTTRNRDLKIFKVLPKFILRRAKRLFPWWLVGTPYASESDLVRWWWLLWSWLCGRDGGCGAGGGRGHGRGRGGFTF